LVFYYHQQQPGNGKNLWNCARYNRMYHFPYSNEKRASLALPIIYAPAFSGKVFLIIIKIILDNINTNLF